ncbi:MAG TPA: dTDP-4-dehydrorhamnose 3,5-epimerase family protein [Thermoanaerobaculia bacterium]
MRFVPLGVPGAYLVEIEPVADARGAFARTFCAREFGERGLATTMVQTSLSLNARRGTLRGLHWQAAPHGEAKLVRCVRGHIYDVAVDVRRDSHAFRQHVAVELSAEARNAIYFPPGVAHGFLTLEDDCEVHYAMSAFHAPEAARGARYDDPAFGVVWPEPVTVVADRDLAWRPFEI